MEIITKELLNEVLGWEDIDYGKIIGNKVVGISNDFIVSEYRINSHELSGIFEEWACKEKGFVISCVISREDNYNFILDIENLDTIIEVPDELDCYSFTNRLEAISKVCQWILDKESK